MLAMVRFNGIQKQRNRQNDGFVAVPMNRPTHVIVAKTQDFWGDAIHRRT